MERLTYVDARGRVLFTPSEEVDENPDIGYDIRQIAEYGYREYLSLIAERLANREQYCEMLEGELKTYKDAEEQGLLLRLPCNVGNMVYQIMNNSDACSDCPHYSEYYGMDSRCTKDSWNTVYNPKWKREPVCDEHFYEIIEIKTDLEYIARHLNDFGKTVFLTKEEAEAALEKMKEGENGLD